MVICGLDLYLLHGFVFDMWVGCIFGYEFVGVVEEVGFLVELFERGDCVVVLFNILCGMCFFCMRGLMGNCENLNLNVFVVFGVYGYSYMMGGFDGG